MSKNLEKASALFFSFNVISLKHVKSYNSYFSSVYQAFRCRQFFVVTFALIFGPSHKSNMASRNYDQVHICVGSYQGRNDWPMLQTMKRLRICKGIQSVRVLLTSNWITSAAGITYEEDGFHRYPGERSANYKPVCKTRYPCYPKGIKDRYADTKGRGKGISQMNRRIQYSFYGLLARTGQAMQRYNESTRNLEMQQKCSNATKIWWILDENKHWEVVLQLNCERRVVAEATQQVMQCIETQRGKPARCVYYRPHCNVWLDRLITQPSEEEMCLYACRLQGCCSAVRSFRGHAGMRVCLFERDQAICIRELLVLLHRNKVTGQAFWNVISFALGAKWNLIIIRGYKAWTRILHRYCHFFDREGQILQPYCRHELFSSSTISAAFALHSLQNNGSVSCRM